MFSDKGLFAHAIIMSQLVLVLCFFLVIETQWYFKSISAHVFFGLFSNNDYHNVLMSSSHSLKYYMLQYQAKLGYLMCFLHVNLFLICYFQ